jgi:hypothetical protein
MGFFTRLFEQQRRWWLTRRLRTQGQTKSFQNFTQTKKCEKTADIKCRCSSVSTWVCWRLFRRGRGRGCRTRPGISWAVPRPVPVGQDCPTDGRENRVNYYNSIFHHTLYTRMIEPKSKQPSVYRKKRTRGWLFNLE